MNACGLQGYRRGEGRIGMNRGAQARRHSRGERSDIFYLFANRGDIIFAHIIDVMAGGRHANRQVFGCHYLRGRHLAEVL